MVPEKTLNTDEVESDFPRVGNFLRSVRLQKKLKLQVVAKHLNLSEETIKNLEKGILDAPPGKAYMRGFLKGYASYLGCSDVWKPLQKLNANVTVETRRRIAGSFGSRGSFPKWFLLFCILGMIGALVTHFFFVYEDNSLSLETQVSISPTPVKVGLDQVELLSKATAPQQAPITPTAPVQKASSFSLKFSAPVWLRITKADGTVAYEGTYTEKDELSLPVEFDGSLHAGNIGAITINYDTKKSKPLGDLGKVVLKHDLNSAELKKLFPNSFF